MSYFEVGDHVIWNNEFFIVDGCVGSGGLIVSSLEREFKACVSKSSVTRASEPEKRSPKDWKLVLSVPQKEKVTFKGWDMSMRDGVWRKIPVGAVFKVIHVTKDGKFIKCTNPDYTNSDIVFHDTEVEYTKIPMELKGMEV